VVESDEGCTIALDPAMDEPLRLEGVARELVNRIQRLRKESGFAVTDRIHLAVFGDGVVLRAAGEHEDYIAAETLATSVITGPQPDGGWTAAVHEVDLDGTRVLIGVRRA
jgi:isoleucyl-tRNA synthetase